MIPIHIYLVSLDESGYEYIREIQGVYIRRTNNFWEAYLFISKRTAERYCELAKSKGFTGARVISYTMEE